CLPPPAQYPASDTRHGKPSRQAGEDATVNKLAIIGAGSWGTALAIRLSQNAENIRLWVFEPELCGSLQKTRVNETYLPGFFLPENVFPTPDLGHALEHADAVLTVVPSQFVRPIYGRIREHLNEDTGSSPIFISATKGLESNTLLRM